MTIWEREAEQNKHDNMVRRVAREYLRSGWNVQADLPSYSRPPTIGGRRPDIKATKPGTTHIIEVETSSTVKTDAGQKPRTKFILIKTR